MNATGWYVTPDGDEVHIRASNLSDESRAQIVALIEQFKREEAERRRAEADDAAGAADTDEAEE